MVIAEFCCIFSLLYLYLSFVGNFCRDLMKKMRRNEFSFMLNSNWLRVEWKSGEPGSHEG